MQLGHAVSGSSVSSEDDDQQAQKKNARGRFYWVGIGASAGGLEALTEMVKNLPLGAGNITYLIAQHLSPKHLSMMVQLIGRETSMPVKEAKHDLVPQADTIYITPINSDLFVKNGKLQLRKPPFPHGPKPSVDFFFTTLAEELGDCSIGVILSGTGSDGAHGVRAIRVSGGLTIAQTPTSAKYDGMPRNAIDTGCVDITLSPAEIGPEIESLIRSPHNVHLLQKPDEKREAMQELMYLLKQHTEADFKDYKMGTLLRRLNRRMTASGVADIDEYLDYIKKEPQELNLFFRDMMITVTQFFRDKEAFEKLREKISELLALKKESGVLRVWVPGCATGEEAYSLVMLFGEAAGGLHKLKANYSFQLFATDIDTEALSFARKGNYSEAALEEVDDGLKSQYFRHRDNSYEVVKDVREMVVFSKHNVINDPPFLRLDLISCRNLLIYFNNNLQNSVMGFFHYSLNHDGVLFLGKSEALGDSANLFQPSDSKAKLFKRKQFASASVSSFARSTYGLINETDLPNKVKSKKASHDFPDAVIKALSPDSLLIDEKMDVLRIYGDMQAYTQLSAGDASTNLSSLIRQEFRLELKALVYKALREDIAFSVLPKKLDINGITHKINVIIRPLKLNSSEERLLLISFEVIQRIEKDKPSSVDATPPLMIELEQELSVTREHLQTVVEELETSNEELQSTNEEMQSTNEELQSSNEELETANEELQSTNEELLTVNDELQLKSAELAETNEDLSSIKESIEIPLLVVDTFLRITRFNQKAADIFVLGEDVIGMALTNLGTRIDIPNLRRNVQGVIESGREFRRQLSEEGEHFLERTLPCRNAQGIVTGAVLTFVNNTQEQRILRQLEDSQERYQLAVNGSNAGIWDWDIRTGVMFWSPLMLRLLGHEDSEPTIEYFKSRIHEDDRPDVLSILDAHLARGFDFDVEYRMKGAGGHYLWVHVRGQALWDEGTEPVRMSGSLYDITERRFAQDNLASTNESLERFAYVCSHDLSEPARLVENFSNILLKQYGATLDETANEYLEIIEQSSLRMREMINGILSYSQLGSKNISLDEVDVAIEIGRALENLKLSIDETGAKVEFQNMPVVRADKMQLFQVFQNLIGNALKFSKEGVDPLIQIDAEKSDGQWIFSIRDNGIGMAPESSQKVFQVFQRLHNADSFSGSGIGLSTCQKIVHKHGGEIWVESELGVGSVFKFSLSTQLKVEGD